MTGDTVAILGCLSEVMDRCLSGDLTVTLEAVPKRHKQATSAAAIHFVACGTEKTLGIDQLMVQIYYVITMASFAIGCAHIVKGSIPQSNILVGGWCRYIGLAQADPENNRHGQNSDHHSNYLHNSIPLAKIDVKNE